MIRVGVYDISGAQDPVGVAAVLRALKADVLGVLDVPGRITLRRLASRSGYEVAARAGRRRGVALLVSERARVLTTDAFSLPSPAGILPRPAIQAIVGVGALRLTVLVTQLGLRPEVRVDHADLLAARAERVEAPTVVLLGANEAPGSTALGRLTAQLTDAFAVAGSGAGETYPTPEPTTRHDHVLVDPRLVLERASVVSDHPATTASHHLPLVVDLAAESAEDEPSARSSAA